ncbi:MAG: glucose 1-dehydrogenase [Actinobacteria bacterium]|nr:glucose 1-dehydrogenase [Actinomycetota bacterium]
MDLPSPFQQFSLEDRVAVVTGASSGLGQRFARTLAGAGARVVLAARRSERIDVLAAELPDAIAVATDVRDDESLQRLTDRAVAAYGKIDVLVNNAGITNDAPALEETPDGIRAVIETNLIGPFLLSQMVARQMIENGGGSIVNICSINSVVASVVGPEASYCASKGGLLQLGRELAVQWADKGIRVNAIGPGYFETEMTADLFAIAAGEAKLKRRTPMRRPGRIEELDGALLFLASPASSYVTGQFLLVDGGWTAV